MKLLLVWPVLLGFSFWLMWHTFSYDFPTSRLLVASKAWSDFGNHLPLIRSFSMGNNWPPQLPLFPGEKIRYHYLFYAVSGLMENWGLNISWALNLPSALSFFSLIFLLFMISRQIFSSRRVGYLTVLFFLFNGSLSFVEYFRRQGLSLASLLGIFSNHQFASFGPWDKGIISAFWNLNIYTNQRHLALGFAVSLLVIYSFLSGRKRLQLLAGLFTGSLLLINQAAFLVTVIFLFFIFIFHPTARFRLILSLPGLIPWLLLAVATIQPPSLPVFQPGYLYSGLILSPGFLNYWWHNLGLHLLLIPLGIIFAPRTARKYFIPLLTIFIIGNLFRFSPDMINNHKFFNFFLLISSGFSAWIILKLKNIFLIIIILFFVIIGGVIDFFPVKNDYFLGINDFRSDPVADYIQKHTLPNAVFLNSNWWYQPPSLVGRPIYNGYSYFTWSYGYDQVTREKNTAAIFASPDRSLVCQRLSSAGISFVLFTLHPEGFINPNWALWHGQFIPEFIDPATGARIYSVARICPAYET